MKHQESTTNNLYLPEMEHDACGIGAVVSIDGEKSRAIVDQALKIVEKLEHRAGRDADGSTGDGVGLMTQIPHAFFRAQPLSFELPGERDYGVAMLFLSPDRLKRAQARKLMEIVVQKEGLRFLGWREVPVNAGVLGERARACMPVIEQAFIARPEDTARGLDFDRRLYTARRIFEQSNADSYVCSMSSRTIVAALLQYAFAIKLGWFPVAQWNGFRYSILPVLTSGAATGACRLSPKPAGAFSACARPRCAESPGAFHPAMSRISSTRLWAAACTKSTCCTPWFSPACGEGSAIPSAG